jgi:enoyl-CoA hydratase/carnithine racemase
VSDDLVLIEEHDDVALVQLNRPGALNALSPEMMAALLGTLEELDLKQRVNAVVIAGHDRAFVSGADIKSMRDRPMGEVFGAESGRFWARLAQIEVPLVAAVSGYAYGGGCELALACDLVVAAESARFSQAEIKVGIMPGGGGSQRLARTLGKHRAMEIVLTGRPVSAAEAEGLGFVNKVVPDDRWRAGALELAHQVASGPPLAIRFAKRAVLAAEESTLTAGMSLERRLLELAFTTQDRVEGMTAFTERRKPRWTGE